MGGRMRGLEAAALVDSHVYKHCAFLHQLQHIAGDEFRSFGAWDKH